MLQRDPFNTETDPNAKEVEELAEFKVSNAMKLAFYTKLTTPAFGCLFMIHIHYSARRLP